MICDDVYIRETGRLVRERLKEHYCEAKMMAVKTPGTTLQALTYKSSRPAALKTFHLAKILPRESSLPSGRYLEATEIRRQKPQINNDTGWRQANRLSENFIYQRV